jgi:hypothetical protein
MLDPLRTTAFFTKVEGKKIKETHFSQKRIYSDLNHTLTENCTVLRYYAESSGNFLTFLTTYRSHL